MLKKWVYFRIIHIILDFLLIYGAFLLAYFFRVGFIFSSDFDFFAFAKFSFVASFLWSGFLILTQYYKIPPKSGLKFIFDLFLIFLGGSVSIAFLLVLFFFEETFFSRLLNFYAFFLAYIFLLSSQFIFKKIIAIRKKRGKEIYKTLVIGANRASEKLIELIEKNPYAPYKIIGIIDPYGLPNNIKITKVLGKLNKLEQICEEKKITSIIQCDAFEHTINLISFCEEKDIKFQFLPSLRGVFEDNLRIREIAGKNVGSFVKRDFVGPKKIRYKIVDFFLRQIFDVD